MYWYDPDLMEPVFEIPTVDGKSMTNRISVARAKALGLLPRVTGILDDMLGANWSLQQYFKRTCIVAAESSPRMPDEDEKDYVERITDIASTDAKEARQRGKDVHRGIEEYLKTGREPDDPATAQACRSLQEALNLSRASGVTSEKTLGGVPEGLVGTPDIWCSDADYSPLLTLAGLAEKDAYDLLWQARGELYISIKTTRLTKFKSPFREHSYQQGGYNYLRRRVASKKPVAFLKWYVDPWSADCRWFLESPEGVDRWTNAFRHLFEAWRFENDYC